MYEQGYIDQAEYEEAVATPLELKTHRRAGARHLPGALLRRPREEGPAAGVQPVARVPGRARCLHDDRHQDPEDGRGRRLLVVQAIERSRCRARLDRSEERTRQGPRRRRGLRHEQVQPRHAGTQAARILVQDVRPRDRARRGSSPEPLHRRILSGRHRLEPEVDRVQRRRQFRIHHPEVRDSRVSQHRIRTADLGAQRQEEVRCREGREDRSPHGHHLRHPAVPVDRAGQPERDPARDGIRVRHACHERHPLPRHRDHQGRRTQR